MNPDRQTAVYNVDHEPIPEDLPVPRGSRLTLLVVTASLGLLVAWAAWATVDQVTRAPARFIAAERTQVIQSPNGGVLQTLHVREGDAVQQGQLLVTFEQESAAAALQKTHSRIAALRASVTRLQAEMSGRPLVFDPQLARDFPDLVNNQQNLYRHRQTALRQELASLQTMIGLVDEERRIHEQLLPTGDVSKADVLRIHKNLADLQAQVSNRRNRHLQETQAELTKAEEELTTQLEQLREHAVQVKHTQLYSPAEGVVNNIRLTTPGAVVRPGETVLELFPTGGALIAETRISPAEIAFVKEGQSALIKLDAFDSTVFGGLTGEVSYISPDVLQEETAEGTSFYYRVHVVVKDREFKGPKAQDIVLRPGLTALVEIKALERSVLSYLTKPIVKTLDVALSER